MPVLLRLLPLSAALAVASTMPAHAQNLVELYESARGYDATYQSARSCPICRPPSRSPKGS